jgi:hypothetical protein
MNQAQPVPSQQSNRYKPNHQQAPKPTPPIHVMNWQNYRYNQYLASNIIVEHRRNPNCQQSNRYNQYRAIAHCEPKPNRYNLYHANKVIRQAKKIGKPNRYKSTGTTSTKAIAS